MSNKKTSEYVFTWKIKNYLSNFQLKGDYIASPIFTIEQLNNSNWCLQISPNGCSDVFQDDVPIVGLFICWILPDKNTEECYVVNYNLDLLDPMDNVFLRLGGDTNSVFDKRFTGYRFRKAIAVDKLIEKMATWSEDTLSLRYYLKFDNLTSNQVLCCGSEVYTTIDIDKGSAEWDLKIPVSQKYAESIVLSLSDLYTFAITLTSAQEVLSISICLQDCKWRLVYPVKFKISFYDAKGNKITYKRAEHLFKVAENWKFPDFLTREHMHGCKVDSSYTEFKLKIDVSVAKGTVSTDGIQDFKFKSFVKLNSSPNSNICVDKVGESKQLSELERCWQRRSLRS